MTCFWDGIIHSLTLEDFRIVGDFTHKPNPRQLAEFLKSKNKYVGICGQGPSDHYDFARWLLDEGIDSVSLNPDTVIETWLKLTRN